VTARTSQLAEPGRRFLAWFLDAAIVAVFAGILYPRQYTHSPDRALVLGWLVVWVVLGFLYLALSDGGPKGATPGKRCVGLRVVDADTGGAIGYGRACLRRAVYIVGGLCLFIGWLWIFTASERQTWHDKAARTIVVRTRWM
jgi:uncharacterized RDD family membrane protein YckC